MSAGWTQPNQHVNWYYAPKPEQEWKRGPGTWKYLWYGGQLHAAYDTADGDFRYRTDGKWSKPTIPPWKLAQMEMAR